MKRFSLRLTEAEYIKLKNHCEELHISMNDVIRQLIREWTPNQPTSDRSINKKIIEDKSLQ
ncbi:MAG: ribbon-helix-helix domain-containing protein [Xenococcaceae cyanobacterium MO_188.B32]|nr:ribbon-helix-helix domain-containing protein [Xenococcaceae cyanobacterium MO_188.B32]